MNRGTIKYAASARCNECKAKIWEEEQEQRRKSVALVVKQEEMASNGSTSCTTVPVTCKACKQTLPALEFSLWRLLYGTGKRSLETC